MATVSYQDAHAAGVEMYNRLAASYRRQVKRFETNHIPESCQNLGAYIALRAMIAKFEPFVTDVNDDGHEVINAIVRDIIAGTEDEDTPKAQA